MLLATCKTLNEFCGQCQIVHVGTRMDRGSPALPLETRMDTGLAMTHHESITWIKTQYLFKAASDLRRMVHIVHMVHTAGACLPAASWPHSI